MIGMDVAELWSEIVRWLSEHAPVTAAALLTPVPPPDLAELEAEFAVELPAELRELWLCCGGTGVDVLADVLPPFYTPYSALEARQAWRDHRKHWAAQWERPACDYYAGSPGSSFHPAWIPIAGDGFADELVVDLRPGPLHGCVLEWEQETGQVLRPEWKSVAAMLFDVRRSLLEGAPAGHSYPTVTEDGRLDWQIR
ncbi:Cell wall assembly regulator SMI1 [Saccharopolyspora antimicrobica]|uniref:Cell wall assembly regulator SMI1 n=1 Tax=Saccharopolyspora antimicrobica TaxID=455193 RepID=A0A1I5HFR3_9PSEU|nr:cell wall assembly regulator SMI1 [Saccharopolyspora antimicrobica]SFO47009.1 Cell wall assembly regulator SMI1 [Saccharopolyspora antimicrobica]